MNILTILDRSSTRYLIALSWMAVLLPAPDEIFAQAAAPAVRTPPTQRVVTLNGAFGEDAYGRAVRALGIVREASFSRARAARHEVE